MKRWILTFSLLILVAVAQAHEFWLQPQKFRFTLGEAVEVDFRLTAAHISRTDGG